MQESGRAYLQESGKAYLQEAPAAPACDEYVARRLNVPLIGCYLTTPERRWPECLFRTNTCPGRARHS